MERADAFSPRLRLLGVATDLASPLALFSIFFLFYPVVLIASGIIQCGLPRVGRWFAWAGITELWVYWSRTTFVCHFRILSCNPFWMFIA
jgi:hypothetical protein